ncbi:MAG: 3-deoxy-manno-octulosonate cytidylyltransferase, partial [Nitrospirota bacterium]|nr:3-deoxy-manno-octulosonate cytidylyltransferase [Nitrospirota bacterium]
MQNAVAIIPARYDSTRFPGKPLADLKGKTMIQRVYENVSKAGLVDS